jgi:hypothetical protein
VNTTHRANRAAKRGNGKEIGARAIVPSNPPKPGFSPMLERLFTKRREDRFAPQMMTPQKASAKASLDAAVKRARQATAHG